MQLKLLQFLGSQKNYYVESQNFITISDPTSSVLLDISGASLHYVIHFLPINFSVFIRIEFKSASRLENLKLAWLWLTVLASLGIEGQNFENCLRLTFTKTDKYKRGLCLVKPIIFNLLFPGRSHRFETKYFFWQV